ncbi:glycosyltransferase family 4 protein [Colwellia psychrerythraea]|uniref:Glycosyl transferase group 1 n=1 Tax=Colwellia psychrerythraea TaxID=28229 RepID=A0A099K8D8_COLPS|nr:glycosyltransferase family 4 protein [Colwellia psychrerythraea]KGJ86545.1 glycosyl transferase group 1 [Colwellia psychrerythraea]
MIKRVLIYDPVPFKGGSKKVMQTIIAELPRNIEVWVISNDKESWCSDYDGCNTCETNVNFVPLFSPRYLQNKTTGILFFLKHFVYLFSLLSNMIRLKRFTKIIGFSGPSVDFSLYLLSEIINIDIVQLVQGNIANSKVSSFGLTRAKQVFYLPSTHSSIVQTLTSHSNNEKITKKKFKPFINGINCSAIKAKDTHNKNSDKVGFLWAASLLKWKRVELFISAVSELNNNHKNIDKYFASVCYIDPQTDAYFDITHLAKVDNLYLYADPKNLNDIRARSSVFISTSEHEPFGLSILEAMAAGLAIVIPADNAYWDQNLTDGYDCIKYNPDDMESLVQALTRLINDPTYLLKIAQQAKHSAQQYCHLRCYSQILKCIPN